MKWVIGILTVLLCLGVVMAKFNMPTFTTPVKSMANTTVVKVYGDHEKALELFKRDGKRQLEIFRNLDSLNPMFQEPPRMVRYEDGSWLQIVSNFGQEIIHVFAKAFQKEGEKKYIEEYLFYLTGLKSDADPTAEDDLYVLFPLGSFDQPVYAIPYQEGEDIPEEHPDFEFFYKEFWEPEPLDFYSLPKEELPFYRFNAVSTGTKTEYVAYLDETDPEHPFSDGNFQHTLFVEGPDGNVVTNVAEDGYNRWTYGNVITGYGGRSRDYLYNQVGGLLSVSKKENEELFCGIYEREEFHSTQQSGVPTDSGSLSLCLTVNGERTVINTQIGRGDVYSGLMTYELDRARLFNPQSDVRTIVLPIGVFYLFSIDMSEINGEHWWAVSKDGNALVFFKKPCREVDEFNRINMVDVGDWFVRNISKMGIIRHRYAVDESESKVSLLDVY